MRNEAAEDFLSLLKEWEKLCRHFLLFGSGKCPQQSSNSVADHPEEDDDNDDEGSEGVEEEFEVERLLAVCFGDPNKQKKHGLYFKVSQLQF